MADARALDLRTINEHRHKKLCMVAPELPPVHMIRESYNGNGVFRAIFTKQSALLHLMHQNPQIKKLWQHTENRFRWDPHNESGYHNDLLDFLRSNRICDHLTLPKAGHTTRIRDRSTAADSYRPKRSHHDDSRGYEASSAPYPRSPLRQSVSNLKRAATGQSPADSKKRNADEIDAAAHTYTKRPESTIEGDPQAMHNGFKNFKEQHKRMKLSHGGVVPAHWDQHAALYECYVDAHLDMGKHPPWRLIEAAQGADTTHGVDDVKSRGERMAELLRILTSASTARVGDTATSTSTAVFPKTSIADSAAAAGNGVYGPPRNTSSFATKPAKAKATDSMEEGALSDVSVYLRNTNSSAKEDITLDTDKRASV